MVMHPADPFYLFPAFLRGTVIEYQSLDLSSIVRYPSRETQVPLCKQIQDQTPIDVFIAKQIIIGILTAFYIHSFPILPGKVTMDVPASIKQHHQQGCHNQGYPDTTLLD